jgi:uncharacterized repeat protein (TIGR01451 family)
LPPTQPNHARLSVALATIHFSPEDTMRIAIAVAMAAVIAASAGLAQSLVGILELISVSSTGVQGNSDSGTTGFTSPSNDRASITADGRFVAFMSFADNLVPGDTNQVADVFVRDRLTGATERVSVSPRGREGDGHSGFGLIAGADISDDGRFIAFVSQATNFARRDTNGNPDVFVHDRLTATTELVSRGLDGDPATGTDVEISADSRFVAFRSFAQNLVPNHPEFDFFDHIYVYDRQTQVIERVDVDNNGVLGNSSAGNLAISADGRYIAFDSFADNLVPGMGDQGGVDVFVRDRVSSTTEGISTGGDTGVFEGNSFLSSISATGRFVGFSSADPTFPGDANGFITDAFVFDRQTGVVQLVSRSSVGTQGNDESSSPLVSADGTSVVFSSRASNLVDGDTNGVFDVFRRDLVTGTTVRLSADDEEFSFDVIGSDITPDGLVVSLLTRAALLPEQDVGFSAMDVYVLDSRPAADLALTKADSPDPVVVRTNLTYTVTVQNMGPVAAAGVVVTDHLPADAVFVSVTTTQGSCTRTGKSSRDGELICALGTVNATAGVTITIVVSPTSAGVTLTNTATVRANSPDLDLANNTAAATTAVVR